jgi:hypothetical protein
MSGHITSDFLQRQQSLKQFFYAELVSIELEDQEGDYCYQRSLESALEENHLKQLLLEPCQMTRINYQKIFHTDPPFG